MPIQRIPGRQIVDNTINSTKIEIEQVRNKNIADEAVDSLKIKNGTIITEDLSDGIITGNKIVDGTIVAQNIANDSVDSNKILDGSINTIDIANDAIDSSKIKAGTIIATDMATGSVTSTIILDSTITANDLATSAVTGAKILDSTITASDLATGAVSSVKILDGTIVDADISTTAGIQGSKIADGTIASTKIVSGTFANAIHNHNASDIIDNDSRRFVTDAEKTIWNNKAEVSYVDTKVANLVNSAPTTLDTLKELADALGDDPNFATTITTSLGNKVDKIAGKGLSTNDFDNTYKTKLDGIAANATLTASSTTNGNIKINGVETIVYTHPANHPASMITGLATIATTGNFTNLNNKPTTLAGYGITDAAPLNHTHVITNSDIASNANIDMNKIDWTGVDFNWYANTIMWPEAPYFQTIPLECKYTNASCAYGYGMVNNWYLPHKLVFNYLNYVIASGGSSGAKARIAIYDINGNLIYMSDQMSVSNGNYKVSVPSLILLPGFYYSVVCCTSGSVKFITSDNYTSAIIPNKGRIYIGGTSINLPNCLDVNNISDSTDKQPWLMFSKI